MAVTMLPDGRWVCYYRRRGPDGKSRVIKEYFGRDSDAESKARARDDELVLRPRRPRRPTSGPDFGKLAEIYFDVHNFASPRAREQHEIRMVSRVLPFFGNRPAVRLTDSDIDNYISRRRAAGVTFSTIRRELVDVKAILNFAVRRRPPLIPFNPIRDYRIPKEDLEVIMPPTAAELGAILAAAPDHLRRIVLIAYYLGLRPGPVECYRLLWENVDWATGTILITGAKKGGPAKRTVPIHPELMPALRSWYEADTKAGVPWVVSWGGKTIKKISTVWEHTLAKAKITRRLRPYDIRHLFVTQALEGGADHKALAELVGSKPETLMKFYQHVSSALHRRTIELIPTAPSMPKVSPRKRKL
jgi:integrase